MNLEQAALIFTTRLAGHNLADASVMQETVIAVTSTVTDVQEIETLLKIARYESGGFRRDIADCRVRGDSGDALGLFQVHAINKQEKIDLCSSDYKKQVRVALSRVRSSAIDCKRKGKFGSALLNEYTSGHCNRGNKASWLRWGDGSELQHLIYTEINHTIPSKGEILVCSEDRMYTPRELQ